MLDEARIHLVERDSVRKLSSAIEIGAEAYVWTIDCGFSKWAERLLRELPQLQSLSALASSITNGTFKMPEGCVLCVRDSPDFFERRLLSTRMVDQLTIDRANRRVDLRWRPVTESDNWLRWNGEKFQIIGSIFERGYGFASNASKREFVVPLGDVPYHGHRGEVAIRTLDMNFVVAQAPFGKFIAEAAKKFLDQRSEQNLLRLKRSCSALSFCLERERNQLDRIAASSGRKLGDFDISSWPDEFLEELLATADITKWDIFETNVPMLQELDE